MNKERIVYHLFRLEKWATAEQRHEAFIALKGLPKTIEIERDELPLDEIGEALDVFINLTAEYYTLIPHKNNLIVISNGGAYDNGVYHTTLYSELSPDSLLVFETDMTPLDLYEYLTEGE
jgi:hypothetical protein